MDVATDFSCSHRRRDLRGQYVGTSRTRTLIVVVFAIQLLIMMMWGTLALYASSLFGFGGAEMGYVSAFAAFIGIGAQTILLKRLLRVIREPTLILAALGIMGLGLLLLAVSASPILLLAGVGLLAGCFNVAMPTAMGIASRLAAERDQGVLMGTASSAISFASVLGPMLSAAIYGVSMRGTYVVGSASAIVATGLCLRVALAPHDYDA